MGRLLHLPVTGTELLHKLSIEQVRVLMIPTDFWFHRLIVRTLRSSVGIRPAHSSSGREVWQPATVPGC